jgi:anthranilate synthase component II
MKIALIDNYDSFTHNVCDLIYRVSGDRVAVLRNDEINYSEFAKLNIDGRCDLARPRPSFPGTGFWCMYRHPATQ